MRKRKIGKSDIEVSAIALGTWSMGGDSQWGVQDDVSSLNAIKTGLENGITLIDTAPVYGFGHSEELVGKAIKEFSRDKLVIETKCGAWWKDNQGTVLVARDGKTIRRNLSRKAMLTEIDESLMRLGTDYIDIYVTHQQPMPPFMVETEEIMGTMQDLKKAGKIRAVGVSNATSQQLSEYLKFGQVDLVQERFSMLNREKAEIFLPLCREHGITMQAYSPLEHGLLTGKMRMDYAVDEKNVRSKNQWFQPQLRSCVLQMLDSWQPLCDKYQCEITDLVIAWTLSQDEQMNVICGGRKQTHVLRYIRAGELELEPADLVRINSDIIKCTSNSKR